MSQFYTVLTNVGAAALANAKALGQDLPITHFAVGTGGGADFAPSVETVKAHTSLVQESHRGAINELKVDPNNPARYYAEGIVPLSVGGFTIREAGWFLSDGTLFAYTVYPPSYKTLLADGVATEVPIRTYIAIGSADNVTLKIDPTVVLATRSYVDQASDYHPVTQPITASARGRYFIAAEGITITLPAVQTLTPGIMIVLRRALGVEAVTLITTDGAAITAQSITTQASNGDLHSSDQFIHNAPGAIELVLNTTLNWEVVRGY